MTRWAHAMGAAAHTFMSFAKRTGTVAYLGQSTEKPPRASLVCLVSLFCFWLVSNEVPTIWDTSTVITHVSSCKVMVVVVVVVIVRVCRANEQTDAGRPQPQSRASDV